MRLQLEKIRVVGILVLLGGCSRNPTPVTAPPLRCAVGDTVLLRETLYFGRNRPGGGVVSDAEWKSFLDDVVTPRFPQGLTILGAVGQWKGASGAVERERSEVVTLLHREEEAAGLAVRDIVVEYKRRFQQEAVLRERTPTCARFE